MKIVNIYNVLVCGML